MINYGVTDKVAEAFCRQLPLTDFKLNRNPLNGAFFKAIPETLRRLDLSDCRLRDNAIIAPQAMTKLEAIDLSDNQVGDLSIAALSPCIRTTLQKLWLSRTDITNDSLKLLAQYEELRELDLSQCRITRFPQSGFLKLEVLDLSETQIDDESLTFIEHLPGLKRLNLGRNQLTNRAIDFIARSKTLENIGIYQTEIDGEALSKRLPDAKLWRRGEDPQIMDQYGAVESWGGGRATRHAFGGVLLDPKQTDIVPQTNTSPKDPLQDTPKKNRMVGDAPSGSP